MYTTKGLEVGDSVRLTVTGQYGRIVAVRYREEEGEIVPLYTVRTRSHEDLYRAYELDGDPLARLDYLSLQAGFRSFSWLLPGRTVEWRYGGLGLRYDTVVDVDASGVVRLSDGLRIWPAMLQRVLPE